MGERLRTKAQRETMKAADKTLRSAHG
jgi:hypothetical protein